MNSIVERLRDYQESWAESINRMDCGEFGDNGIMSQIRAEQHATWKDAADLIEQQAARIAELEVGLQIAKHNEQCTHDANVNLCKELATLRQRIADAPVVAWMGEYNINDIRDHYTVVMRNKTDFDRMPERVRPLYTHPQPAIPEWQPIETAPRDGTYFICFNGNWRGLSRYWEPNYEDDPIWVDETTEFISPPPTHWMPLPAAPEVPK